MDYLNLSLEKGCHLSYSSFLTIRTTLSAYYAVCFIIFCNAHYSQIIMIHHNTISVFSCASHFQFHISLLFPTSPLLYFIYHNNQHIFFEQRHYIDIPDTKEIHLLAQLTGILLTARGRPTHLSASLLLLLYTCLYARTGLDLYVLCLCPTRD